MTRANINFISQKDGEGPKVLYLYHNGDQYPSGIRDHYNVIDFVSGEMTEERFLSWVEGNYDDEVKKIDNPNVYYDNNGFITDYSYVFDGTGIGEEIKVWEWDEKIFGGTKEEFVEWIKKQEL